MTGGYVFTSLSVNRGEGTPSLDGWEGWYPIQLDGVGTPIQTARGGGTPISGMGGGCGEYSHPPWRGRGVPHPPGDTTSTYDGRIFTWRMKV